MVGRDDRRTWLWSASGLLAVGLAATVVGWMHSRVLPTGERNAAFGVSVQRVGQGQWRRVFGNALRMEKARAVYVSDGQIAFSPRGRLQNSSWSLEALQDNGSWQLIQMTTVGQGRFSAEISRGTGSVTVGPTAGELADLVQSRALIRWCEAHPADQYLLSIQTGTNSVVPKGAPILWFENGRLTPGPGDPLPYTVALVGLKRVGHTHTATSSSVSYMGQPAAYIQF